MPWWGEPRRATGCVRLAKALREARAHRKMTQAELASRAADAMAAFTIMPWDKRPISRTQVAQWEGAHRRIEAAQLRAIEDALEVDFIGVSRDCHARHHRGRFCHSDLGAGPLSVTARPSGNVILEIDGRG